MPRLKSLPPVRLIAIAIGGLFGSLLGDATAGQLSVPADFPTIQQAIGAASDGDVVLVAPGTYVENLNFLGKSISVVSSGGAAVTTVDGNGAGGVIQFSSGENEATLLEGFTLTNGNAPDGGGIFCLNSSPRIVSCVISDNFAADDGGGIYCFDSGAPLPGGSASTPLIDSCIVRNNSCGDDGGGLLCSVSSPRIIGSWFEGNSSAGGSPNPNGGGIHTRDGATPIIDRCYFLGNHAEQGGGAIRCFSSSPTITNCVIIANTSDANGAGIRVYSSSPIITNCTIYGNSALGSGGGVEIETASNTSLTNCILWENSAASGPDLLLGTPTAASVTYCDLPVTWPGVGNISLAPLFVDPTGPDGDPATGDEDLHLLAISPCVDTGTNTAPSIPLLDYDGDDRVSDGDSDGTLTVDIGADELGFSFRRGDVNNDGGFDVSDVVYALAALFIPGSPPATCKDAADVNDDGLIDVSDAVYALAALFVPGAAPAPTPGSTQCGPDPTADLLDCSSSCP